MLSDTPPLIPKSPDGCAQILLIGRLSKPKETDDETQLTIESSLAVAKAHLHRIYEGPMQLTTLAEQESGQVADRATIREAEDLIASGRVDLVITEDLSRIFRTPRHQHAFIDDCVDAGVRAICVADGIDTAEEGWETAMGVASFRHSLPVMDTRRRQRRRNVYSFHRGGNVQKIKYGYRKLSREEAASGEFGPVGLRIAKEPQATGIIRRMRELLLESRNYSRVVDWLRAEEVPVGPYVKKPNGWTPRLVKSLLSDPILIGTRRFRTTVFTRIRKTGRFRRSTNPDGPETERHPELAHLTEEEFDTLQEAIREIDAQHSRLKGSESPRYRKARKDTIFPRQHATCAACGGLMHAYDANSIKCANAYRNRQSRCWNHVQVDLVLLRRKFIPWLLTQIDNQPGARQLITDYATAEVASLRATLQRGGSSRRANILRLKQELANITKAIRLGGNLESLVAEARQLEEQLRKLEELETQVIADERALPTCSHPDEIEQNLDAILQQLAAESSGFAQLMRDIFPQFEIVPVQAFDTGQVVPRVRMTLDLSRLGPSSDLEAPVLPICGELDVFTPPKYLRHLAACLEVKRQFPKYSYPKIAAAINEQLASIVPAGEPAETISYMSVKRCFDIARRMEAEGITTPYRVLTQAPEYASRWR